MAFAQIAQWQAHDAIGRRKYVSAAERAAFLNLTNELGQRDRALCRVLAFTGCRVSEALALTRHQLDTEQCTVTIRTLKRRRLVFRLVHIPEGLAAELAALPVAEDGRLWPMHRTTAWRRVKHVMIGAGIHGPMACCRGLRHGFGVRGAAAGLPLPLLQRLLGHASMSMTAVYVDVVGLEERSFVSRMWD